MKLIPFKIRLTPEQYKILEARARAAGFCHKSEYARSLLFLELTAMEKIDKIYRKVIENE